MAKCHNFSFGGGKKVFITSGGGDGEKVREEDYILEALVATFVQANLISH